MSGAGAGIQFDIGRDSVERALERVDDSISKIKLDGTSGTVGCDHHSNIVGAYCDLADVSKLGVKIAYDSNVKLDHLIAAKKNGHKPGAEISLTKGGLTARGLTPEAAGRIMTMLYRGIGLLTVLWILAKLHGLDPLALLGKGAP